MLRAVTSAGGAFYEPLDNSFSSRPRVAGASLVCVILLGVLFAPFNAHAYSVLTHEAIIDSSSDKDIRPLLLQRFPKATPDELNTAHAFAYGGCAIQDLGYYPSGNKFFSDLVHYVRTGDSSSP